MSSTIIDRIGLLVTHDDERPERTDAALVIDDGRVAWVGDAGAAPDADERVDADGACVIPGFVDSHNHLVFAGDRAAEFEAPDDRTGICRWRHPHDGRRDPRRER